MGHLAPAFSTLTTRVVPLWSRSDDLTPLQKTLHESPISLWGKVQPDQPLPMAFLKASLASLTPALSWPSCYSWNRLPPALCASRLLIPLPEMPFPLLPTGELLHLSQVFAQTMPSQWALFRHRIKPLSVACTLNSSLPCSTLFHSTHQLLTCNANRCFCYVYYLFPHPRIHASWTYEFVCFLFIGVCQESRIGPGN